MIDYSEYFTYSDGLLLDNKGVSRGSKRKDGYVEMSIGSKYTSQVKELRHRVIWKILIGDIPDGFEIDHKNQIKGDDRIENLRMVTHSENMKNQPKRKKKSNLPTGVSICRDKYHSYICVDGVKIHLGSFVNIDDAVMARENAKIEYKFHENHA